MSHSIDASRQPSKAPSCGEQAISDSSLGALIDQRRALSAQLAGVELQIAMFVGDRDAARQHLKEMNAQTGARYAARFAAQNGQGAH